MLQEDKEKLKQILSDYSPQEIMTQLSELAVQAADQLSDNGLKDQAKDLVKFSISLDDLISGRPFLV